MKKKLIIGAGIVLAVFVLFLILLGGGSSTNKIVTEEELDITFTNITCEVKDEENINYEISTLTNDISFDSVLQNKQYTKITINKEKGFQSLGLAFIVKSNEEFTLNISLEKNGTSLTSTSVEFKDGAMKNVNLLLNEAVEILESDEFTISFTQSTECSFTFDTLLFFFDEV